MKGRSSGPVLFCEEVKGGARVRTVIAPLLPEVEAELLALDARLQQIARGYVRRLALEPYLGPTARRGALATMGVRRIYFGRGDQPGQLLGRLKSGARPGHADPASGPQWRIVYLVREATRSDVRLIVNLAIGEAHSSQPDVYERATRRALKIRRSSP
jgi:hypothetical protein